nr:ribonuclease P protein component [Flavipsychrobacter sp. JY13-12]
MRNTFKAYERLKREQHIDTLFRTGKAFSVFPLKFIYQAVPRGAEPSPVRVGFSVPKKKHRLSVTRHRIRRLMAEAWRLQKQELYPAIPEDTQIQLFILYTDTTANPTQEQVMKAVLKGMGKLKTAINPQVEPS